MTDRELLEYAANAAGIKIYESTDGTIQNRPVWVFSAGGGMGTMPYEEQWNPLREDAQALRLAVKLEMCVDFMDRRVIAGELPEVVIDFEDGDYRRAIVKAAAKIGWTMV